LGKYAKWHSDKTAKTGFVGFGISYLGVIGIYYVGCNRLQSIQSRQAYGICQSLPESQDQCVQ
jgi:hypothetical protein